MAVKILIGAYGISIIQKVSEVSGVKAKVDVLEMNMRILSAKKDDVANELKKIERTPGKKRKKEVELWMQSVGWLEDQVHKLGRRVREGYFFSLIMLEGPMSGLATQMKNLRYMGGFDNSLALDVTQDRGSELQPGEQFWINESTPLSHCLNHLPLVELEGLLSGGAELQLREQSGTNEMTLLPNCLEQSRINELNPLPGCLDHLPLLELEVLQSGGSELQLGEQPRPNQSKPLSDYLNLLPLWELEIVRSLENLHLAPCKGLRYLEEPRELDLNFCSSLSTLRPITAAFRLV